MTSTRGFATAVCIALALGLTPAAAAKDPKTPSETVRFAAGATSAVRTGAIHGYAGREYVVRAAAGQTMTTRGFATAVVLALALGLAHGSEIFSA
jgi:adenine/guanine phosphoribosyltransferase-like PRPP-binding protein